MKRLVLLLPVVCAACRSHDPHRVTDLGNGRVYYTRDMRRGLSSGYVYLTDVKTGAKVTVQASKVEELSEEDFRLAAGVK